MYNLMEPGEINPFPFLCCTSGVPCFRFPREITVRLLILIFLQLHFIHGLTLSEYNALLAIKSAITHDPLDFLSSWNSTIHHCNWPGVDCCPSPSHKFFWLNYINCSSTPNGSVVCLDISGHNLTGSLSPDIGFLRYLRYLDARDNRLSGPLPSSLSLLSALQIIYLSDNNFNGAIPEFIGDLPELEELALSENNLSGSVPQKLGTNGKLDTLDLWRNKLTGKFPESLGGCQSLTYIDVADNFLSGSIPKALFGLPKLQFLYLEDNRFSGSFSEANDSVALILRVMVLTNNELSGRIPPSIGNFSALVNLYLDGNSFTGSIPPEISKLHRVIDIVLGNNALSGEIPRGIISNLTGSQLYLLDISNDLLRGALPILPPKLGELFASNNNLSGPIVSICNSRTSLKALDLSNNMLAGQIPSCLINSSINLRVLTLRSNNLSGSIPAKFTRCDNLTDLDLSDNQLEGIVPRSLAQCNNLEVLNLGNNMFNDNFPYWLGTLSKLQVLNLRSNHFYGPMTRSCSKQLFSKLGILDLSNNSFNGTLPSTFIKNMRAMRCMDESENKSQKYLTMGFVSFGNPYYYSINLMAKSYYRHVERILETMTTIDISSNMFQGDIPTSIWELQALRWLNLSHNNFSDHIPPAIGNLKALESLDLSCNNLSGEIPQEIKRLTSLEFFNVSQNRLVGPIPQNTQLSTFNNDSYLGNSELCGPPLSKKCTNEDAPQHLPLTSVNPPDTEWALNVHLWEVTLMGCGVGWVGGWCNLRLLHDIGSRTSMTINISLSVRVSGAAMDEETCQGTSSGNKELRKR